MHASMRQLLCTAPLDLIIIIIWVPCFRFLPLLDAYNFLLLLACV